MEKSEEGVETVFQSSEETTEETIEQTNDNDKRCVDENAESNKDGSSEENHVVQNVERSVQGVKDPGSPKEHKQEEKERDEGAFVNQDSNMIDSTSLNSPKDSGNEVEKMHIVPETTSDGKNETVVTETADGGPVQIFSPKDNTVSSCVLSSSKTGSINSPGAAFSQGSENLGMLHSDISNAGTENDSVLQDRDSNLPDSVMRPNVDVKFPEPQVAPDDSDLGKQFSPETQYSSNIVEASSESSPNSPVDTPVSIEKGLRLPDNATMSPEGRPRSLDDVQMLPDGGPRSPDDVPKSPEGGPSSPDDAPMSPDGGPKSPFTAPLSSNDGPKSPDDVQMSPDGGPQSPDDTLASPHGGPKSPDDASVSQGATSVNLQHGGSQSSGDEAMSSDEGARIQEYETNLASSASALSDEGSQDTSSLQQRSVPRSPTDGPKSPDYGPQSPASLERDSKSPEESLDVQKTATDTDDVVVSNPQSPSDVSDEDDGEEIPLQEDQKDSIHRMMEDEDSLNLAASAFKRKVEDLAHSPKNQDSIDPEDINSPESDMGERQSRNIPSNTEDIDSPESDLDEGEEESEDKSAKMLESAASPISESDNESLGEGESETVMRNDMYNDVSDEEDSFSDDVDEGDQKIDAYKVDSAVKDALKPSEKESEPKWSRNDDRRKVDGKGVRESMMSVPSHSGLGDDELDYDEDGMEEDSGKIHEENKEKMDDNRGMENAEKEKKEDGEADSDKDDGELDDDEDCEEGEIREPGQRKPYQKPTCRFFTRGVCTWGNNCRFLHPGVNDKGNYRLIERPENAPYGRGSGPWKGQDESPPPAEEEEESPALPPPPPLPPRPETAWERGLRQAKEQLKKANQRKEAEPDFEQKRLNLTVEEEREFNKENERQKLMYKDPYYDQGYEDEYYDKPIQRSPSPIGWQQGHYENFEVRWTREPEWPPPHVPHYRERIPPEEKFHHPAFTPPVIQNFQQSSQRRHHHHHQRDNRRRNNNKQWEGERVPSQAYQEPVTRHKADTWHDPWRRSKSPKRKARSSRSRSRGRRRSRRSHSYSSSFSSSSFSGSSRSRSSSYSSYSSRSSSRSSSSSRSPSHSPVKRPQGAPGKKIAEPGKPGEKPRSAATAKGAQQKPPVRRQSSRSQGGAQPQVNLPPGQRPRAPGGGGGPPPLAGPDANIRDKAKDKPPTAQRPPKRPGGRSMTRSRSRSSSSASSRSSSASSLSSISSSGSSSSGSADSEHLYRGVGGGKEDAPVSPKKKKGPKAAKPKEKAVGPGDRPMDPSARGPRVGHRQEARVTTAAQPTVKPKDPLKLTGQKPNIKLTLLANKPPVEKGAAGAKKRPAGDAEMPGAPASKKPTPAPQAPKSDKKVKKPEKPAVAKPTTAQPKVPAQQPVAPPVKNTSKPPAGGATGAVPVVKEKKSTSSRREELLKQLKAVEDAIARKRSKMN